MDVFADNKQNIAYYARERHFWTWLHILVSVLISSQIFSLCFSVLFGSLFIEVYSYMFVVQASDIVPTKLRQEG